MAEANPSTGMGRVDRFLQELFPFHIVLNFGSTATIVRIGSSLEGWIGRDLAGLAFDDCFSVLRPGGAVIDSETVAARQDAVFVFDVIGHAAQLRGQLVAVAEDRAVFIGSPVLTTTTRVDELGLSMSDFAPHDATLDLIVLQRFTEMQLSDLQDQAAELSAAQQDRDRMSESALTDPLTGLANRRAFWSRCGDEIRGNRPIVLLFIDVDGFKAVNDVYGHSIGDDVLRGIGAQLCTAVRSDDLVARLGGDEFAVLLTMADDEIADAVIGRIRSTAREVLEVDGNVIRFSLSIGVVSRTANQTVDDLLQDADSAMYEGRMQGPGRVTWFADRMRAEREERRALTEDLDQAIESGNVATFFQPIIELQSGTMVACEALARWNHAERGPIDPGRFIELAERSGFIDRLDMLVMDRSLTNVLDWRRGAPNLSVQVNMSGRSIGPQLADRIAETLQATGIAAEALTVEVTESWLMQNETEVAAVLNEVAELGVQVHLDDFGTGYSSLAHVHALPISGLKIDRSFVLQATESERSRRLIAATIGMAHSLGLEVIAEGVEDAATAELLVELGCNYGQGFLFARPAPEDSIAEIIESGNRSLYQRYEVER